MSPVGRLLRPCLALAYAAVQVSAAPPKLLESRLTEGVKIEYQEPHICETTPGVKSYSGYLTLPPSSLQPYAQNLFFWFFESRHAPETAPFTVWLQGGPGAPSIDQALSENGPCLVNADSNSTTLNPWSWNEYANMLYIDSPVQTGFSYEEATKGVVDMVTGEITPGPFNGTLNLATVGGTFASQNPDHTVNSTTVAAEAIYQFVQAWMGEFKQYRREKISIWSQSFGGHYAPAIANLFHTRSATASKCKSGGYPFKVEVDSVGIVNGLLDFLTMGGHLPNFANNNTYGIKSYEDDAIWEGVMTNWTKPGGCKDQATACAALTPNGYHDQFGTNLSVIETCGGAVEMCGNYMFLAFDVYSKREHFDIARTKPTPEGPVYVYGFLAQDWVLKALGAKVNFTQGHTPTENAFFGTGDFFFGGFLDDLASLIDDGVKVSLIHGDRDYRCNWVAGEAASLAINHRDAESFASAGYTKLNTNDSYVGGMVRQHGKFSFTRVFQAGHSVAYYQPETLYQIFMRTIRGQDVATGQVDLGQQAGYATEGPASVFDIKNELPAAVETSCYVAAQLPLTCTEEQMLALADGTAEVDGLIVTRPAA